LAGAGRESVAGYRRSVGPADASEGFEFPTDFPIKIMGPATTVCAGHRRRGAAACARLRRLDAGNAQFKDGNYLSLTATVHAVSREQLDALYRALTSHPMVKVVL
jgi:putative lipoic acid-binding regulatory protein